MDRSPWDEVAGGDGGEEQQGPRGQRRQERERRRQEAQRQAQDQDSEDDSDTELLKSMANLEVTEKGPPQHKGTGLIYDKLFTRHKCEWDASYPECPQRVLKPLERCQQLGLVERCVRIPLRYATEDQIQWQHSMRHLELAKDTSTMSAKQLKELAKKYDSWYCNKATFECSLAAAGSSIELMDQILQKKITNGFALVRPPGHHAMQSEFCGYCVFNNAAIAASHALNHGVKRVLIVDWDVHHGQATQYMFYNDPRVMYFSIHRYEHGEFWPNLRESDYDFIGEGNGRGYNINVPLNKTGLGDSDYMAVVLQLLMPLAHEFSPQVVIISSGYDAAVGCPEGDMLVSPAAYAHFIHLVSGLCEGRVCTILEGGYCLQSLAEGCALTLRSLLRDPCPQLPPLPEPSDSVISSILNVIKVLRPYWQCFDDFETLEHGELCVFEDVNSSPPREGVEFVTPDNRPSEYEIMGCYPQQSKDTIQKFSRQIGRLVAETSLTKAPHRTCFVFDAAMRKHRNVFDSTHPERPKRISCIFEKHREWGLLARCLQLESRSATDEEILAVHSAQYLEDMKESATMNDDELSSRPRKMKYNSIFMCQETYNSALLSAGCVVQVTDAVLSGKAQSGVAVVRPPGHHAECSAAMGFCFFNNVAIAAAYAKNKFGIKRVLILDWDVHHGNATQHMFYNDPSVLYISLHRYENGFFFPASPEANYSYVGQEEGRGFNVNIPWSRERMGNAEYMAAFQRIVMPIAYEYSPELVLVSAGFDAAAGDFLGGYRLMPECYAHMNHMLSGLANGRVVLALEGGYYAQAISVSMAMCTSVLLGDPCPPIGLGIPNSCALETIREVLGVQKEFWKSLKFAVKIPSIERESAHLSSPLAFGKAELDSGENLDSASEAGGISTHPGVAEHSKKGGNRHHPGSNPETTQQQHPTGQEGRTKTEGSSVGAPGGDGQLPQQPAAMLSEDSKPDSAQGSVDQVVAGTGQLSRSSSDTGRGAQGKVSEESVERVVAGTREPSQSTSDTGRGAEGSLSEGVEVDEDEVERAESPSSAQPVKSEDDQNERERAAAADAGPSNEAGAGGGSGSDEQPLGACGGAWRPNTVADVLKMQGVEQLFAVQPLPWCPHLPSVRPLPPQGLDTDLPCEDCGDVTENWVCLICYKVFCSRYVQEHMLFHSVAEEHLVVLSYSDLSVWCYACNDYIDNQITHPMKNAAHLRKFGEPLPNRWASD